VLLIPAKAIPDALERCGRKGIPRAIIQSAGFSEFTDGRRQLEENLLNISRRWNIRFIRGKIGVVCCSDGQAVTLRTPYLGMALRWPVFPTAFLIMSGRKSGPV
jgi:acetyltransferase